jgi:hypothetical protein
VGPDREVVLVGEALHAVDVVLHDVDQHDRRGGVDPLEKGVECSLEPVHADLLALLLGTIKGRECLSCPR